MTMINLSEKYSYEYISFINKIFEYLYYFDEENSLDWN